MKLFIKNMIGYSSIKEVKNLLQYFGLSPTSVRLGEIEIAGGISYKSYTQLNEVLLQNDFELIRDREIILAEKIQNVIIEMIHFSDQLPSTKYSTYISEQLEMNYAYLSKFFSHVKKYTIEKFIITQKIERIKQLLLFNELTLSDIASRLNYSSTGHLCAQFKKLTGYSPSVFKKLQYKNIDCHPTD